MDASIRRSLRAVAPRTLEDLYVPGKTVALYVHSKTCPGCQKWKATGKKKKFERHDWMVIPLDVARPAYRAVATSAGVREMPAYVVLAPGAQPEVVNVDL